MANGSDEGVQIMSSYSVGVVACHFRCFLWGFFDHMLAHLMSVLFLDLGEGTYRERGMLRTTVNCLRAFALHREGVGV